MKTTNKDTVTKEILQDLEPLAKVLKVGVGELWSIFVRQYVVKGISELFTALVLFGAAFLLKDFIHYWALIPVVVGIYLVYDTINLVGNPKYWAIDDITKKVKEFSDV